MIWMEYDPLFGTAVPDGHINDGVENIRWAVAHSTGFNYKFSTENIFLAIRVAIAEGSLDNKNIMFVFDGHAMEVDEYGDWSPHYDGFLGVMALLSRRVMLAGSAARIAKKGLDK